MNKKAFTLIELLASITILAIILIITVPNISGFVKNSYKQAYSEHLNTLEDAAKKYVLTESIRLEDWTQREVTLSEMIATEMTSEIRDPRTNELCDGYVMASRDYDDYQFEPYLKCGDNYLTENYGSKDMLSPIITILGDNPTNIFIGNTYSDAGATASDDPDGDITNRIEVSGTINPNVPGTYSISYSVRDISENVTTAVRTVNVVDNVGPSIAFDPKTSTTYKKSGNSTVAVSDASSIDATTLKYIWTTSTVAPTVATFATSFTNNQKINTPLSVSGGYYLWVIAKDTAGNQTIARSDIFNLDNTKPVIVLKGTANVTINKGSAYTDAGATVTDNVNSNMTVVASGSVNVNVAGTYTITYNATDSSGNVASTVTRTIDVVDVLAPVITLVGSNPVSINIGALYDDAGATALDEGDGDVTSNIFTTGTINLAVIGTYTITYTVSDAAGNNATSSRTVYVIDNIAPSVPTVLGMRFGDLATNYTNNTWTNKDVYMYPGISGSTDANGVAKYQISADNVNWIDYSYNTSNSVYLLTTNGTYYRYARAVDKAGNVSGVLSKTIKIDKTAPSVPTVMGMTFSDGVTAYANGSWSNQAVYMYGGISGSTDANGIAKYQISSNNVNWVDYVYDYTNSMYGLGSQGVQYRYARAVDAAGNVSGALTKTIAIDVTAPAHTNWWWGGTSSAGGSLYIEANDPISGINRVQCPTSTQTGANANWYWFNAVWDAPANAYRCDITSATFAHYGETYLTHLYIWDNAGNGGYYNATTMYVNPNVVLTSQVVTFTESTVRNQTKTVQLPGLTSIASVTVNTGSVTYTLSGENITLNAINGVSTRSSSYTCTDCSCGTSTCCDGYNPSTGQYYGCTSCYTCDPVTRTEYYYSYTVTIQYYKKG